VSTLKSRSFGLTKSLIGGLLDCVFHPTCNERYLIALKLSSAHPQMANLPDICVLLKILSSEYQPYACGKIFRTP